MNDNLPALILRTTELIKLTNVYLNHGPKHEKLSLCLTIRNTGYLMYEQIVDAYNSHHKKKILSDLNKTHKKLKMLFKLYFDLGYFEYRRNKQDDTVEESLRRYQAIGKLMAEIGRMIGGWIKRFNEQERVS